jgi:hypothetical protein
MSAKAVDPACHPFLTHVILRASRVKGHCGHCMGKVPNYHEPALMLGLTCRKIVEDLKQRSIRPDVRSLVVEKTVDLPLFLRSKVQIH